MAEGRESWKWRSYRSQLRLRTGTGDPEMSVGAVLKGLFRKPVHKAEG